MTTNEKSLDEVLEMLRQQRIAMLTSHDEGRMVTRPMGVQSVDDDGTLWFFTEAGSDKAEQIAADPHVNVAFAGDDYLSVAGTASVVQDHAKQEELWGPATTAWMQCEPTDPKVALIRVEADSIGYWDTPNAAGSLFAMAKGAITGQRPDQAGAGESGVVEV